jgi:glycosyltransferase involved in cell wall biosynthesis
MSATDRKFRLLIFIVAYNAERTIEKTLRRIPASLLDKYDVEVLVIDDSSKDQTFERGDALRRAKELPFPLTVLFNPVNQGYGGNQKIGFHYAIEKGFDFVALVHGDGQYAPELLPELVEPLAEGDADAVFGSRMMTKDGARKGGMPLYKFFGNKILTRAQNLLLRADLSEFHSGYRIYSVAALKKIPFHLNSNVFHFDTEIIIQLLVACQRIVELPIPTYYGDEICHVNGMKYAKDVLVASLKARMQELSLFYDRKFDCKPSVDGNAHYLPKLEFDSTHSRVANYLPRGSRVLDIGCAGGYLAEELMRRGCRVTGVDMFPLEPGVKLDEFHLVDLNRESLPVDFREYDYAIMLDVIEHLLSPETFVDRFLENAAYAPDLKFIISTANIGFFFTRLMLFIGKFNYGKRGILDLTHTRLFTFKTLRGMLKQSGFDVVTEQGVPAPFPLAVGNTALGRMFISINKSLIAVNKSLFSYQMIMVVKARPSLKYLLREAHTQSETRASATARESLVSAIPVPSE